MARHQDRTAVVTGAGSGIGQSVALRLAADGAAVACADIDEESSERTAGEIRAAGGEAQSFALDVTSWDSVVHLRDDVQATYGKIDILASIAGVLLREHLDEHDAESWRRVIDINLTGVYFCAKAFLPGMRERQWGRIINMGSVAGLTGYYYPSYAASKAGVINLTRNLVLESNGTGVTANSVCPGTIDTGMLKREVIPAIIEKNPVGRLGVPDDVAALLSFLASEEAGFINGAAIVIDGGATSVFRYFDDA